MWQKAALYGSSWARETDSYLQQSLYLFNKTWGDPAIVKPYFHALSFDQVFYKENAAQVVQRTILRFIHLNSQNAYWRPLLEVLSLCCQRKAS